MDGATIEQMLRSALPIEGVDQVVMVPGGKITLVWVGIADRPDLASLAHRHGREQGYFLATWFYADPGRQDMVVGLRVDMRAPIKTVFHLAFKVEKFCEELETLAHSGQLWIIPGPPPAHLTGTRVMNMQEMLAIGGQGVAFQLDPQMRAELHNQLLAWKQRGP